MPEPRADVCEHSRRSAEAPPNALPRLSDLKVFPRVVPRGLAACQKGLSVGFNTAAALVHELLEARDEKRLLRLQRQLATYKLLVIDELGYVPLSQTGAELLFEVFSQRYEPGSTIVTSNWDCQESCVRP